MRTSKTSSRGGEFGLHVSEFTAVRELTAVRRARGEIDSAELKAHTAVVQSAFDATDASLKARRFKGVTGTPLAPAALEQRPLLTETPEELIYLRVKEGSKEIASRRGIPATSETTYLELTNLAVMCYLTANDWERLEPLPMIAETFVDHNETERSKITMPMTGRAAANVNKYVRVTITSARAPVIVRRTVNETLMAADRASRSVPRKYVQVGVKELHYPEKLFNEMVEQLVSLELGVHRSDVDALTNFMKALRDAVVSCEGTDMAVPVTFGNYAARRSPGNKNRARAHMFESRAGQLQNLARLPCIASSERWSSFAKDVNALVAVLTNKFTTMNREADQAATRRATTRDFPAGLANVETAEAAEGGTAVSRT